MMKPILVFPNVASTSAKLPAPQIQRQLIAARMENVRRASKEIKEARAINAATNAQIALLAKAPKRRIAVNSK